MKAAKGKKSIALWAALLALLLTSASAFAVPKNRVWAKIEPGPFSQLADASQPLEAHQACGAFVYDLAAESLVAPRGGSGEIPGVIFREGSPSPSNLTPRAVDEGMLSFRGSLSNPVPMGQRPVLRPGKPYFGIDTSKLPAGSVIIDDIPPGHVSVKDVPVQVLKQAVVIKGKFPK